MLHPDLDAAFDDLLVAWRHHDERRASGAPVPRLFETRRGLDEARDRVRRLRRGLYPEEGEIGEAAFAVTCPSLDATVVVYAQEVHGGQNQYRCVCGADVAHPMAPLPAGNDY